MRDDNVKDLAAADAFVPQGLTTREALELAALDAAVFRGASKKTLERRLSIVSKDGSIRPGTGRVREERGGEAGPPTEAL